MSIKFFVIGLLNILFIISPALAENYSDSIVPPIQYPEKTKDELQVRKEIKSSFFSIDEMKESNLDKIKENNLDNSKSSFLDNNSEKPKTRAVDEIISKKNMPNKIENKKNFSLILKDQEQNSSSSELWKVFTLSVLFLSIIGLVGFILSRVKKKGIFSLAKTEKAMEIVSTLSLSPKRQIIILKIRDQEIVLSSTESGINFITEVSGLNSHSKPLLDKRQSHIIDKLPLQRQDRMISDKLEGKNDSNTYSQEKISEKKSDILLKALKSINSNSLNQKTNKDSDEAPLTQNKVDNFPKYLANQFENESKKEIKKKEDESDSVENVTNLIREKLRSMKPLN